MPTSALRTYANNYRLQPYVDPEHARTRSVKLPASISYTKGTVLGETFGGNEIQTIVVDATGGTFTITYAGDTTTALDFDATAAEVEAALEALDAVGSGNVSVVARSTRYTLTHTDGTDGGTFALRVTIGGVSANTTALAWNVAAADIDTALEALDNAPAGSFTVSGSDGGPYTITFLPTIGEVGLEVVNDLTTDGGVFEGGVVLANLANGAYIVTFQNDLGAGNVGAMTTDATLLTGGAGTATVATPTAGSAGTAGTFRAYDPAGSDGRQIARCILEYDVETDSSGNVTLFSSEHGETYASAPAYFCGTFATADLVGLDDAAVAQLGRLITGTVAQGVLRMG
jgi:hypothetical protein